MFAHDTTKLSTKRINLVLFKTTWMLYPIDFVKKAEYKQRQKRRNWIRTRSSEVKFQF